MLIGICNHDGGACEGMGVKGGAERRVSSSVGTLPWLWRVADVGRAAQVYSLTSTLTARTQQPAAYRHSAQHSVSGGPGCAPHHPPPTASTHPAIDPHCHCAKCASHFIIIFKIILNRQRKVNHHYEYNSYVH